MKPIPQEQFDMAVENLEYQGLVQTELDQSVTITDRGDAYLERLMHDKPEMFILVFLFYLTSTEEGGKLRGG